MGKEIVWVSKSVLAKYLKLQKNGSQIVNNWASRGKIKKKWDANTGQWLVEKIRKIPTNDRRVINL
jgi:thymidylate synthase